MIATTIEQSKELLRLGLPAESADMAWIKGLFGDDVIYAGKAGDSSTPAWSLSALLEVMPSFIDYKGQKLRLTIEKAGVWNVFYLGTEHRLNEIWFNGKYGDPVEPVYKMVCWLLEQELVKKGDNDE